MQIGHEFEPFITYVPRIKVAVFCEEAPVREQRLKLTRECPQIVVGTPGWILKLAREDFLSLTNVKHFIFDRCDKILESFCKFSTMFELMTVTSVSLLNYGHKVICSLLIVIQFHGLYVM